MIAMGQRPPVLVGEKLLWLGSGSGLPQGGVVRWIGQLPEIGPDWAVGIELDVKVLITKLPAVRIDQQAILDCASRFAVLRPLNRTCQHDKELPYGGIDGTWCGRVLFTCKPKHGLIVPISSIIPASKLRFIQNSCGNHPDFSSFQSTVPNLNQSAEDDVPEKSVTNDCAKPLPAVRKKHHNNIKTESNVLPPSAPPRHKQSPKPVNIYNDLNRVSVKNDLPINIQLETVAAEDKCLQNDILIREESFVQNISGTNNGQNKRMSIFTSRYESSYEEAVIDSIYAERRRNFARHGRSHSDSAHAVVSTSSTSTSSRREKGNSGLFSFFRWFKKEKDTVSEGDDVGNNNDDIGIPSIPASPKLIRGYSSSCGSVDTLFSTATANSFAFVHPSVYRPFGSACVPETRIASGPETETYRNRIRQRDRLRELDKNITLRKKYNLLGSDTIYRSADNLRGKYFTGNKSTDSLKESPASKNSTFGSRKKRKAPQPPLLEREHSDYSLPSTLEHISKDKNKLGDLKNDSKNRPHHRRTVSDSAKDKKAGAYCHVRGKRKAPPPPSAPLLPADNDNSLSKVTGSSGKKKRPAPQPPIAFCSARTNVTKEDVKRPQINLTPEERQRLIENIAKLQAHADKNNTASPPSSPDFQVKSPHTICNDSLKLEKGILRANKAEMQVPEVKPAPSSPVSPRPWYKRGIISKDAGTQNGKSLEKKKNRSKGKSDEWMPEVGFPRRSIVGTENNRFSNIFSKVNEEKRKSQISMLVNISELDREAAEIVQKEQEREKAKLAEQNAKFYNPHIGLPIDLSSENKLSSAENVETPKRSSAKELISLFNAIGNVTKVTVNSAFFSKEGPSIFTKQGIEKRFSFVGEKTEEKVIVKESISQSNGYKRETVVIDTQETYLESPGVKRRKNLYNCDNTNETIIIDNDTSSTSSNSSSDKYSPKVTIEELDAYDAEKTSKTQAMYEANRLRRHHSPSPSIPTIVEMSESVSSVTTSPGSTINNNRTVTPEPLQHAKRVSFWVCPRCTLENARWRVTCDACDLWRPVQDNMNDIPITNDVATASIITQNIEKDKNSARSEKISTNVNSIIENNINKNVDKIIENPLKVDSKVIGLDKVEVNMVTNISTSKPRSATEKQPEKNSASQKPSDKVSNESDINELRRVRLAFFEKTLDQENTNESDINSNSESTLPNNNLPSQPNINDLQTKATGGSSIATNEEERLKIKEMLKEMKNSLPKRQKPTSDNSKNIESVSKTNDTHVDKISGNFGLHVDTEKLLSSEKINININKFGAVNSSKDVSVNKVINNSEIQIDAQKHTSSENIRNTKYEELNGDKDVHMDKITTNFGSHVDPTKLGAIRKVPLPKPFVGNDTKTKQNKNSISNLGSKNDEKAEAYLVKSEMILEDIKVRKPEKVSTSVQTNSVINKVENHPAVVTNCDVGKPPVGKVSPKSTRKEFVVPVTVEEYKIKDGVLYTSLTKEAKRIGTGTFELIRARDFASIEATKTGNEAVSVHVYANVPTSNTCVQEQTQSQWEKHLPANSGSETTEVEKLTAQLTQPKGLADFKARLEGNKSMAADRVNTLAVNRLLRKLEAAIAGGQHHQAAVLAKELARLKINCSVTRHKETVNANIITIDMYVEDKVSHQGPIPLHINPSLTVAQLKLKVEKEFEIPVHVQRWILGKQLAVDDKATLKQLSVDTPHCPVFLYLVAPEGGLEKPPVKNNVQEKKTLTETVYNNITNAGAAALQQPEDKKVFYSGEDDRYSLCESDRTQLSSKEPSPEVELEEQIEIEEEADDEEENEIEIEIEEEEEEEEEIEVRINREELPRTGTLTLGWKCPVCTLVNSPTRPGCLACTTARPVDYVVPAEYQASGAEMARLNMEEENQKEAAEEKMKHYQQLVNLENADLVASTEPFECSVCFVNYAPEEGVVLRECLHTFCKACLANMVEFSEEAEVKCPYRDEQYACDSTLQEREIKALVTPEMYEQHLAKSVAQAENKIGNTFHCKSPDCPGWCIFEDNVNIFNCPVCGKTNCLTCQAIHNGMNCKQYQEQVNEDSETNAEARRTKEMLQEMVERGEAMNCPTCQVVLMKKWGCDWLRCSMCKTEICWVTRGPRWGPGGKGDISGGCQCGVNGIKCHPRCNYCH